MNTTTLHRAVVLALAAPLALTACGGGGGMVRSSPAPVSTPPAAPPPASRTGPCPTPLSSDCVLKQPEGVGNAYMYGGRSSDHSLIKQDGWFVDMREGQYRFAGGTRVEAGLLTVGASATLVSDARVLPGATLEVTGTLKGDAKTDPATAGTVGGHLYMAGTIQGDVGNDGMVTAAIHDPAWYGAQKPANRITGAFQQAESGTLRIFLPYLDYAAPLTVDGRADIAGTLTLARYESWDPIGPSFLYPLPATPTTALILHATGGVFGTFDRWTSPGLFIEGDLRYGSNDVWFDLNRISVQSAMESQGFGGPTLASAANLDRALAIADGFAAAPDDAQSRFLQSAGRLLWLGDAQQAARSLDSLAGTEHAHLATDAQARSSTAARRLAMHAGARRMDGLPLRWSLPLADGRLDGYDQWLGPRILVGGSVGREASTANGASINEQRASLYLHHRGDRWQGTVVASAGRGTGLLQRRIDLGDGRAHVAGTQRRIDLAELHAELARPFAWAGGELQPYAAIDAGMVSGSGFLEQGDTGFELTSDGGARHQLGAALGLRYARDWRIGAQRVGLLADLQRAQRLQAGGHWQAAFLGVPDARFDLRDWSDPRSHTARLSLQGGAIGGWQWAFSGLRDSHRGASTSWQLRFGRDF